MLFYPCRGWYSFFASLAADWGVALVNGLCYLPRITSLYYLLVCGAAASYLVHNPCILNLKINGLIKSKTADAPVLKRHAPFIVSDHVLFSV